MTPKDYPEKAKPMPVTDEIVEKGIIANGMADKIKMFLITSIIGMFGFFGNHFLDEFSAFNQEVITQFKEVNSRVYEGFKETNRSIMSIRDEVSKSREESRVNSTKNSTRLDAHDLIFRTQDKRISSIEENQRLRQ